MRQIITSETKRVLEQIAESFLIKKFYLAGGTALAIQLGHRQSIDLDWFSAGKFSNAEIKNALTKVWVFKLTSEEEGTIHGILNGVKVSFLFYGYGMLYPLVDYKNVRLADERDIAAMKIDAVSSRGSKKDFIDIYFLLEKYSLSELIGFFEKKYKKIKFNKLHILKSLVYFEDAEKEPMPLMIKKDGWEQIKKRISKETNKIIKW
ncbi:MAG: hypothetical protein COT24_04690 [Candidatus Kerfeldbacteria bacterium CG08_land_8_20_14_0_20_40_16]|uniref:Nucleotidyl transferase AbiEii/AbiGii toxin family protein n=1 Tax=Candidatus Kerfeldbacteria bacterium CG08_land_8_20_14_0_20_40_16 TaxID=2014244 RepID=A0A2H0YUN9_9BACT|nr:MAG: hypothetical protein COT24_04690 [Candidatus Kerfeldbacteria bacterium CG08_land_8_20_14_0_20_40_16]